MCGIFGYITTAGAGPDIARLQRIAAETETRGRHAFGLGWLGRDNQLRTFKRSGAATDNLNDLRRCRDAVIVVGHCRYATHGSPDDNRNNHPHRAGRGWIVHNGVVMNYEELIARYELSPSTECDSEVLGMLMARFPGSLEQRAERVAQVAEGRLAILGVWRNPARLVIVRNGNPLWFGETRDGLYFGSLPGELPGHTQAIAERTPHVLTYGKSRPLHTGQAIRKRAQT
jgi:glucosamine--fructose-6-phosphate aminotransferase (isomerizing)